MLIKDIFIELRSRLRSCNVFITTGVDFSKNCNLKVSIQAGCIILSYHKDNYCNLKRKDSLSSIESLSDCYSEDESDSCGTSDESDSCVISIRQYCQIIPNSMSCLKIDKNTISFRILTEPGNGGNFYKELLTANGFESTKTDNNLKLNVKASEDIKIVCSNCSNAVSNDYIKFDRTLELPTSNLDMSEWFCHGHSHSSNSQDIVLKPNKKDFLYRLTYFMVNSSLLSEKMNKFNVKREIYHCDRCLAWLGMKEKDAVKLFNSEVKMIQNSLENHVFSQKTSKEVHTDDFIYTIEHLTKEFNLGLQYTVLCKIVLVCTISAFKKQYLLIWVMDKELQVLRDDGEKILDDKVELQSSVVTKILYKVEFCMNDEVETWLSDPAVVSTDISKNMFCNGLEHLQKMSQKVPEYFRSTNGYCVTYLKV